MNPTSLRTWSCALVGLALTSALVTATPQAKPGSSEAAPVTSRVLPPAPKGSLNGYVLAQMATYPLDGSYGYHWPKPGSDPWAGTTQTLTYQGKRLCKGDPLKRSYCCGLTFELYVTSLLKASGGEVKGLSQGELHELRLRFFGDSKVGERRRLAAFGLESLGLGKQLKKLEDARPGDFVQFWRHPGKSGHSAIFVNWTRNRAGKITGLVYWSSQSSTQGIGYNRESIGPKGIKRNEIYLGRADWPLKPKRRAKSVFEAH